MTVVLVWPDKGIPKKCKKLEIIHFLHLLWWWLCVSRVIPLFPAHKTRDLNNWGKVRQKAEKKGKIWAVAKPSRGFIPPPLRRLCRTNWRRRWWIKYEPVKGLAPIWVRRRGGWNPFMGAVCSMQHNRRHFFSIQTFLAPSVYCWQGIRNGIHHLWWRPRGKMITTYTKENFNVNLFDNWPCCKYSIHSGGRKCKWGGYQSQNRAGSKWLKLAHTELSLDLNRPVLPVTALMLCKPGRKSWLANLPFLLSKLSQFIL